MTRSSRAAVICLSVAAAAAAAVWSRRLVRHMERINGMAAEINSDIDALIASGHHDDLDLLGSLADDLELASSRSSREAAFSQLRLIARQSRRAAEQAR